MELNDLYLPVMDVYHCFRTKIIWLRCTIFTDEKQLSQIVLNKNAIFVSVLKFHLVSSVSNGVHRQCLKKLMLRSIHHSLTNESFSLLCCFQIELDIEYQFFGLWVFNYFVMTQADQMIFMNSKTVYFFEPLKIFAVLYMCENIQK